MATASRLLPATRLMVLAALAIWVCVWVLKPTSRWKKAWHGAEDWAARSVLRDVGLHVLVFCFPVLAAAAMAYLCMHLLSRGGRIRYNQAEIIQSLRWKIGPKLPEEIQEKLNYSEKEYFRNHSAAIKDYMLEPEIDLDLTVVRRIISNAHVETGNYIMDVNCLLRFTFCENMNLVTGYGSSKGSLYPRVLDDIGDNLSLGNHSFSLTKNSVHSVRRTDAEQYISQGLMEEFMG